MPAATWTVVEFPATIRSLTFAYNSAHEITNDQWVPQRHGAVRLRRGRDRSGTRLHQRRPGQRQPSIPGSPPLKPSQVVAAVTKDPDNHTTTYMLDALGRVTEEIDANNATTTYLRDFAGQVTEMTDPLGGVTTYQYSYGSGDGDLTQVTYPDGSYATFSYSATYHKLTGERDTQI